MIVVSKSTGHGLDATEYPRSRTAIYPPNDHTVNAAKNAAGGWSHIQTRGVRGLGTLDTSAIPTWAYWLVGGVAVGGLVGYFFLKK